MSMFDYYKPSASLKCPQCECGLSELRFVKGTNVSVLSGPGADPLHEFLDGGSE